jgi:hypothetical protein
LRDPGEPAERLHDRDGRGIDEGDAVPQDVARGHAHEQRALADGELGNRADPDQAGLMLLVAVEMPSREALEGGPALAAGRNELALVLADGAARRRFVRRHELAAAGLADEGRHQAAPDFGPMRFVPQRAARRNALPALAFVRSDAIGKRRMA